MTVTNKHFKRILQSSFFLTTAIVALLVVPANKDLTFGYGSSDTGGHVTTPTCGAAKPASAPVLLSAVASGTNAITLNWSQAQDPVTYYLVTFGTKPGEQLYGNPNVGGRGTTTYTISNLSSNQIYYFKVRAGNDCMPGSFSNEVSAKPFGLVLASAPVGFQQGVLGAETTNKKVGQNKSVPTPTAVKLSDAVTPKQNATTENNGGFFQAIITFIKHLFGGN